jgi:hypothetical protein
MLRKLGVAAVLAAVATGAVAPADASSASARPRSATVQQVVARGPNYIVATGEAVETDIDPASPWTMISGTCQVARQGSTVVVEGVDVVCYILDVTEDVKYMHSAWALNLPAHANWTAWDLKKDHRFRLCMWTGRSTDEWTDSSPTTCADLK